MSTLSRKVLYLLVLLGFSITLAVFVSDIPGANAQTDPAAPPSFTSPLEPPTPESVSRSPQAEIALAYLSQQHAMPVKELLIVNEHERTYPLISRTFKAFTIWTRDPDHLRDFRLLVDLADGHVEADVNAIIAQEEAAYRAKYGKLHPDLYERLQSVDADEMLPIAVWMAPDPKVRTQAEIFADLAARYPGAAESLTEMGVPWAVENPSVAEEIRQSYFRALSEDTQRRIQPLVSQLEELGFETMTFEPVPSVAARLPKSAILTLSERDDAGMIYLLEGKIAPAMAEAAATNRMTTAWYQGNLSGAGRFIAMLEPTNIQNTGCLNVIATRTANNGAYDPNHKTHVASALACNHPNHPNLRGIAYGASLIDAAFNATQGDGYPDLSWALRWAITEQPNNQNAEVVNASFGYDTSQAMQWSDRVIDYWARAGKVTIVVAAQNEGGNVRSPGKGWNIITVGALDDRGNSNWSDDVMAGFSNWINPASTNGDHEKPEVVAPGLGITMVGPGGNLVNPPINGTSYAAPQVAGLAALLRNRNGALVNRPEAVKAIIMATAAHNVHGPRNMPSGQDLRDGAGAIDAALALSTAGVTGGTGNNNATCNQPCWWATDTITVTPGTFITRDFRATRGERVRVAIAWWSDANWTGLSDVLRTNLDLRVMAPSGGQVTDGYSASWDNSNELVEFVAPETGVYTIRVMRAAGDTSAESNEIGIAWTKQATYLPDVRGSNSGWTSNITIRNDGAEPRDVTITYLWDNGTFAASRSYAAENAGNLLEPNATWTVQPPSWFNGSAIVDGSEDVSVVVEQVQGTQTSAYAGIQSGGAGDANWGRVGTDLTLPYVYHSYYGYTSDIALLNTGGVNATVTLTYCNQTGGGCSNANHTVPVGQRLVVQPAPGTNFYGSVRIQSSQPVAVVADARNVNIDISNQASVGVTTAHLPYVMKGYYGWDSCFVMRNLSSSAQNVTVVYHWLTGSHTVNQSVNGNAMWTSCQKDLPGSVPNGGLSATISASYPIAVAINQSHNADGKHMSYNATGQAGHSVILPILMKSHVRNGQTWASGYQVQNAGSANTCPSVTYYSTTGTAVGPLTLDCIDPGKAVGLYLPNVTQIGNGQWSAVVTASQPLAGTANATCVNGCSGDTVYAYPAVTRESTLFLHRQTCRVF